VFVRHVGPLTVRFEIGRGGRSTRSIEAHDLAVAMH
jgi:hypothetical protein